jgi:hypothetical protein
MDRSLKLLVYVFCPPVAATAVVLLMVNPAPFEKYQRDEGPWAKVM